MAAKQTTAAARIPVVLIIVPPLSDEEPLSRLAVTRM
jgi:hypothetical protein